MVNNLEIAKTAYTQEIKPALNDAGEQYLAMMKVHNTKVQKIHGKYSDYCKLRIQATETGIPFEDL